MSLRPSWHQPHAHVPCTGHRLFATQPTALALYSPLLSCRYLRHADVYIVCLTRNNPNAMLAFKFMTSVRQDWSPAHSIREFGAAGNRGWLRLRLIALL